MYTQVCGILTIWHHLWMVFVLLNRVWFDFQVFFKVVCYCIFFLLEKCSCTILTCWSFLCVCMGQADGRSGDGSQDVV